jgi:dynein light chain Tctex-type 1
MDHEAGMDQLTEDDLIDDAEVDTMVREAVTAAVGDSQFLHNKIDAWTSSIAEGCLKRLASLGKPFKYVITVNLAQKAGAGLHVASCTRWNDKTDGKLVVQWCARTAARPSPPCAAPGPAMRRVCGAHAGCVQRPAARRGPVPPAPCQDAPTTQPLAPCPLPPPGSTRENATIMALVAVYWLGI